MSLPAIIVSPLNARRIAFDRYRPDAVISLLAPDAVDAPPPEMSAVPWLDLRFNDISTPQGDLVLPSSSQIAALLDFAEKYPRILVHCFAGISRSTAAAYAIGCARKQNCDAGGLARELRRLSPMATPNALMVKLADAALGREGAMMDAIKAIGRGADAFEGCVFAWEMA